jgi:hypothetical protein
MAKMKMAKSGDNENRRNSIVSVSWRSAVMAMKAAKDNRLGGVNESVKNREKHEEMKSKCGEIINNEMAKASAIIKTKKRQIGNMSYQHRTIWRPARHEIMQRNQSKQKNRRHSLFACRMATAATAAAGDSTAAANMNRRKRRKA